MGEALQKLTLRGFKSIEALDDFELGKLTVLIGANGAGKSNFVDFFRMLRALADEALQKFVNQQGGADRLFFLGPKYTREVWAHLVFGENQYRFTLEPAADSGLIVGQEETLYTGGMGAGTWSIIGRGKLESAICDLKNEGGRLGARHGVEYYVHESLVSWVVYHFHDTSMAAPMRRDQSVRDRGALRHDGSNIAAFLLHLRKRHEETYTQIRDAVRLVAPFLDEFFLEPEKNGELEQVRLEWRQKGSDFPFQPSQLSDGTIRFICLATALSQPFPPATIVIDEPELGLHPFAISMLAELIQSAAERRQVIVSTQSPLLLDCFKPKDVVVVNRLEGRSIFQRLDKEELRDWLADYTIGELWQKNVVQGGPENA